jgi:hypothetical protein
MRVIDPCIPASTSNPILWRKAFNAFLNLHAVRLALRAEGCLASTTTEDAQYNRLLRMWASYAHSYLKAAPEPSSIASSRPPIASPGRAPPSGPRRMHRTRNQQQAAPAVVMRPEASGCTSTRPMIAAADGRGSAGTPTSRYSHCDAVRSALRRLFIISCGCGAE